LRECEDALTPGSEIELGAPTLLQSLVGFVTNFFDTLGSLIDVRWLVAWRRPHPELCLATTGG
jgi:hypothetical protein